MNRIASFFVSGDGFHSRSKAAIKFKKDTGYYIERTFYFYTSDPASIISIERDPFEHAELFSQYVADNMRSINIGAPT